MPAISLENDDPRGTEHGPQAAMHMIMDPEVVRQLFAVPAVDAGIARLSPREREILGLLAEGWSNVAIVESLHLAARSVEKHVTAIFTKLDQARIQLCDAARSRAAAFRWQPLPPA